MSNRLRNGLTEEQVAKAFELFNKVKLRTICESENINPSTIYNILRGTSSNLELLATVINRANEEIKKREQVADSLPL